MNRRSAIGSQRSAVHARRGFTLVEMVVVIGVILVLVAITVGTITTLSRSAETRRTQDLLTLLDAAYSEWKTTSERDISYGVDGQPMVGVQYEIQQDLLPGNADDHEATDQLLEIINRSAPAREILARIDSRLLQRHPPPDDELTAIDAWDTEIITVFPGRLWVAGVDPGTAPDDLDGTIRTAFENVFGECTNRRVRFVSAGPDALFGDFSAATGTVAREAARDNLYSYRVEAP